MDILMLTGANPQHTLVGDIQGMSWPVPAWRCRMMKWVTGDELGSSVLANGIGVLLSMALPHGDATGGQRN